MKNNELIGKILITNWYDLDHANLITDVKKSRHDGRIIFSSNKYVDFFHSQFVELIKNGTLIDNDENLYFYIIDNTELSRLLFLG